VGEGTSKRSSLTCPLCGYTTPRINVEAQANQSRPKERLIAVATTKEGTVGKKYRLPNKKDELAINASRQKLDARIKRHTGKLTLIPSEELPYLRSIFNVHVYGYRDWGSLFTERQKLAITTMFDCVERARQQLTRDNEDAEFATAVATLLAFCADRIVANCNTLSWWVISWEVASSAFARQALGMVWDFTEIYPFAEEEGWFKVCEWVSESLEVLGRVPTERGTAVQSSADVLPLPDHAAHVGFTDPPYYDAVPYADLSDFFYVWLKRSIGPLYPELFSAELSPKKSEIVELAGRNPSYAYKTKNYFETRMSKAFEALRVVIGPSGIIVIVFAHTATESWEALLQAALNAGLVVTGSWPIDTEKTNRPRAQSSATLSSSVHIVCRPRENLDDLVGTDEIGDWRDLLQELPRRIHAWMPRLAEEGVVGADAIFACLGPALEIFSRHSRVEKASGEAVTLQEYLEYVWAAVAKEALALVFKDADTAGFEADARLTAMWLWTLQTGESMRTTRMKKTMRMRLRLRLERRTKRNPAGSSSNTTPRARSHRASAVTSKI
jgi:putative DNA methylase